MKAIRHGKLLQVCCFLLGAGTALPAGAQTFNGLAFDGSNDYVSLPNTTPVPIGNNAYTIEAWMKTAGVGSYGIVGWGTFGAGNQCNALRTNFNNLYNYWWGNDINVPTADLSGAWHHVAATFDGTDRCLYLDGVKIGCDQPGSTHAVPNANNLRIGSTNNGEYFYGSLDEIRVWNRALCQAELQNNMYGELPNPTTQTGLVAYYKANQGTAGSSNTGITTLTDASASGKNGTLTNFALSGSTSNWVSGAGAITGNVNPFSSAIPAAVTESVTDTISGATSFTGCAIVSSIIPTGGGTAVSGSVMSKVTVDTSVGTFHGQPYVQRHYDIEPATNANTATADIVLYFTQAEFTAYNAARGSLPPLPVDTTDAANNKANLRITQMHGIPSGGNAPGNYPATWGGSGPAHVLLTPSSVVWNGSASRWEVTCSVTGFSGFFASTSAAPLPVTLIDFSAMKKTNSDVLLTWHIGQPEEGTRYVVERSADASSFAAIGSIYGGQATAYTYHDLQPAGRKLYYRLHIVEQDGTASFSKILPVSMDGYTNVRIYPLPAKDYFVMQTDETTDATATLSDMQGRAILKFPAANGTRVDTKGLQPGLYLLSVGRQVLKVVIE